MPRRPQFYKVDAVADMFGVAEFTVREWLRDGKLEGFKVNGRWRVKQEAIDKLANNLYGKEVTSER